MQYGIRCIGNEETDFGGNKIIITLRGKETWYVNCTPDKDYIFESLNEAYQFKDRKGLSNRYNCEYLVEEYLPIQ